MNILGPNWKTTLSGGVFTLAIAIAADNKLVAFLPQSWQGTVCGLAGLIAVLSGGTFAYQVKDRNVTGGSVPQTHEAEARAQSLPLK
jgi:hypothetical protein